MVPAQKPGRSKQDYATPTVFITAVQRLLGISAFAWDFAADADNRKAILYYDEELDALTADWTDGLYEPDEWGWLNPPYAHIGLWAEKALASGLKIAMLVPASVGSNWYRDCINGMYGVRVLFLNGRLSFDGIAPYPKDLMLVLFGGDQAGDPFSSDVWNWRNA